ncbi:MAG: two-component system, chemotaxis family, sensor kinase CheA, partial [Solirubrobacteraceae bacterium]|nr:two-component system, chemotaxis family, sensor kinase CheA [Solirubrobacteraceae bacterium]
MPRRDSELMARLLATFGVEADEHLVALRRHLLELSAERPEAETRALVEATFRDMHTLKGAARSVGQRDVERVCSSCEALLSVLKRSEALPGAAVIALLEEAVGAIGALLEGRAGTPVPADLLQRLDRAVIDPGDAAPQPGADPELLHAPGPAVAPKPAATIRMATDDLDTLLQRGEELLSIKLAADLWVSGAEAFHEQVRRAQRADDPPAEMRALEASARAMVTGLRRDRRAIAGAVDGLLEQAQRVRMMPASSVLDRLPLMARDLAQSQDKQVEFVAVGEELSVDRRVLEAIKDPLIHMVRNAVDHGLELPAEREAAGKPP